MISNAVGFHLGGCQIIYGGNKVVGFINQGLAYELANLPNSGSKK